MYLLGIFGGGSVLWISSSVKDDGRAPRRWPSAPHTAPPCSGLFVAFAFLAGLRGGAQGGPIALEAADVVHVMLAPGRSSSGAAAPGHATRARRDLHRRHRRRHRRPARRSTPCPARCSRGPAGGALFGATSRPCGPAPHCSRTRCALPRWVATAAGIAHVAWQSAAVACHMPGPADCSAASACGAGGSTRSTWSPWPSPSSASSSGFVLLAPHLAGSARPAQRAGRAAALRRHHAGPAHRHPAAPPAESGAHRAVARGCGSRPAKGGSGFTGTVWRRGWHGLLRFPAPRLVRMAALAAAIGVLQAATVRGTTPALLGSALLGFVLGLEVMEPLSQEVDQPDRTDSLPGRARRADGASPGSHPLSPSCRSRSSPVSRRVLTLGGNADAIAPAAILALPTLLGGAWAASSASSATPPTRSAPSSQQSFMPPEMAGFSTHPSAVADRGQRLRLPCTVFFLRAR